MSAISEDSLLQPPKLLLADDDPAIRRTYGTALSQVGYRVLEAEDGAEALDMVARDRPDLVILDVDMPRLDGWETLQRLREVDAGIPVIMLTAHNDIDRRVRGLGEGADDYLGKPCPYRELVARVGALLRRTQPKRGELPTFVFGDVVVDLKQRTATRAGEPLALTRTEFALLECFARRRDAAVSREEILDAVWGYRPQSNTRTLKTHIWRLRAKLGDNGAEPRWIRNVAGVGYQLVYDQPQSPGLKSESARADASGKYHAQKDSDC